MRVATTLLVLLFLITVANAQRFVPPPLIGPIAYSVSPNTDAIYFFQDVGTGQAWSLNIASLDADTRLQSWSPTGCYALLHNSLFTNEFGLYDVQARTLTTINLPVDDTSGSRYLESRPLLSADGSRLLYTVRDMSSRATEFIAYDLTTGTTSLLFTRQTYPDNPRVILWAWPSDSTILYRESQTRALFEVNITTGKLRYVVPDPFPARPSYPATSQALWSPDNQRLALYFSLPETNGITGPRTVILNEQEVAAYQAAVRPYPGMDVFDAMTGETQSFTLQGQVVRAAAWSPDSRYLVAFTQPPDRDAVLPGVFLYNRVSRAMIAFTDLPALNDVSVPSWSGDSQWVTLYGADVGWVAYQPATAIRIPLDELFQDQFINSVRLGPVSQYEPGTCGGPTT